MKMKSLTYRTVLVAALVCVGAPARADVFGIGRGIGEGIGSAAVKEIDPVLSKALDKTDTILTKHEDRVGNLIGGTIDQVSTETKQRLDQVDGILEKRITQVQLGVDQVLDHGLDKIDGVARNNIARIDVTLAKRIAQVDGTVEKALNRVDGILDKQIASVGRTVTGAIDQTNVVLTARLEQADEIAGRRLANVDVVATKQRLGLERTITRAAWLIGLIVFVVVVLRALWVEYLRREDEIPKDATKAERTRRTLAILVKPLLRHAAVGAIAAALLAIVPESLPMAAAKEQQALADKHATELERSLVALDWTRVRFHASQLEFLDTKDAARYQAMAAKADLLRDVLENPTAFASPAGRGATLSKIDALDRLQGGRRDPDALTVRAMILWAHGTTKADELQAATLSARALWSSPRGFTLAPMARLMIEAYLHAPMAFAPASADPKAEAEVPESVEGLRAALEMEIPLRPGSPFEGLVTLFHLMRDLDETSSAAYLEMVTAQVDVSRHAKTKDDADLAVAAKKRNDAADRVVKAWEKFDAALLSSAAIVASPSVLGIFRLDDALLTHALWFTTQPTTVDWPIPLASLNKDKAEDKRLLLALAPARAVWARRYIGLLQGPARELVELQEARRFEDLEQQALLFEQTYGATMPAPDAKGTNGERIATQLEAVSAAAALGLHEGTGTERKSLAAKLTEKLEGVKANVALVLDRKKTDIDDALAKKDAQLRLDINKKSRAASKALHAKAKDLMDELRRNIQGRPATLI
ncbi:MAG TPA: hypothetical protein VN903_26755 [Polyangia bacterium]|jgi:hypothetical protein|nr:hypothetical protein [Polyangia bacterium]